MKRMGPPTALAVAFPAIPRTNARTVPSCPRIGGPANAYPSRILVVVQAQRQKKADQEPPSYSDVLLQREQQLWDRQVALAEAAAKDARANYETLLQAHTALQAQLAAERAAAERREDALRKENAELRSQLMYAAAQLAASASDRRGGTGSAGDDNDVMDARGAAAHLPSPAAAPQQGQSAPDQGFSGSGYVASPPPPAASAVPVQPSWASEIEAAMAAVDEVDILTQDVDYAALAAAKQAQQAASTPPPPPPPAPETPPAEETAPAAPTGPPPTLVIGADDIFWVNQLHTALTDSGYYPGDEDIDDYFFGESTQSAVMTLQACEGLSETGVVDDATWAVLLGSELTLKPSRDLTADQLNPHLPGITTPGRDGSILGQKKPFAELFTATSETAAVMGADGAVEAASLRTTVTETDVYADGRVVQDSVTVSERAVPAPGGGLRVEAATAATHRETAAPLTKWPVLIEGDGGKEVHALHVLLENAGYCAGEDDERWWQFGDTTVNALKTFQACSGLPESGACDANTWMALLGPGATPADLASVRSGASDDEDLADDGGGTRVWLMGEQRWEDRRKLG